jgi:hypothetical protein
VTEEEPVTVLETDSTKTTKMHPLGYSKDESNKDLADNLFHSAHASIYTADTMCFRRRRQLITVSNEVLPEQIKLPAA